jgi:hypothetical protein
VGRTGKNRKSDARAQGTNPRFPWKPSTATLTCGLTGTKKPYGVATTDLTTIHPRHASRNDHPESSRTTVRPKPGAASLTCTNVDHRLLLLVV